MVRDIRKIVLNDVIEMTEEFLEENGIRENVYGSRTMAQMSLDQFDVFDIFHKLEKSYRINLSRLYKFQQDVVSFTPKEIASYVLSQVR